MNEEGPDFTEASEPSITQPPKKRHKALILLILIILLLGAMIVGGASWYLTQRNKPKQVVTDFLESVRAVDIDAMKSLIQSNDYTVLTDADIQNPVFYDFFREINSQMTYQITNVHFNLQEGAAQVTAHITYVDGTTIYQEAISEFLREMVSTAFYGDGEVDQASQKELAALLQSKASELDPVFTEADIIYPLVETDEGWKISVLDEQTILIMSSNFKNILDEIQKTVDSSAAGPGEETTPAEQASEEAGALDYTSDNFSLTYVKHEVQSDFAGNPCLLLYYDYTNHADTPSSPMVDVHIAAYQHGSALTATISASNIAEVDNYLKETTSGETVTVCQVFELSDLSNVTIQMEEAFSLGNSNVQSQILILE